MEVIPWGSYWLHLLWCCCSLLQVPANKGTCILQVTIDAIWLKAEESLNTPRDITSTSGCLPQSQMQKWFLTPPCKSKWRILHFVMVWMGIAKHFEFALTLLLLTKWMLASRQHYRRTRHQTWLSWHLVLYQQGEVKWMGVEPPRKVVMVLRPDWL